MHFVSMLLKKTSIIAVVSVQILFSPIATFSARAEADNQVVADSPASSSVQANEPTTNPTVVEPPVENPTTPTVQAPSPTVTAPAPQQQPSPVSPIMPVQPGPTAPTGASANTYVYNPATGLWENDYYTWNPATGLTQSKTAAPYSFNPATGTWDTVEWVYHPESGQYKPSIISTAQNPSTARSLSMPADSAFALSADNAGPFSDNEVILNSNLNQDYDLQFDATISNQISSSTETGDALVGSNNHAGDALTGDAETIVNVLNVLQSSWSATQGELHTFVADVEGDVFGDIIINPGKITNPNLSSANNIADEVDINISADTQINNNIVLGSTSGNADVEKNTKAGDAKSGSANAVANIMNLMNSSIAAGDSFMGTINIRGNLDGDILMQEGMLEELLASNAPRTTLDLSKIENKELVASFTENQTINNNINLAASSGNANVDSNTKAGDAKTGSATTNLTLLNLTGREVVSENSLLVFVNVLGEWVGLIMDAPAGSTSAAIGGGVKTNNLIAPSNESTTFDSDNTSEINNNVLINAASGDAAVRENSEAGDATSGDATASANILNIINSRLSTNGWFGVLFINVFGSWHGSFGVDTMNGDHRDSDYSGRGSAESSKDVAVFQFVPGENGNYVLEPKDTNDFEQASYASSTNGSDAGGSTLQASSEDTATSIAQGNNAEPQASIKTYPPYARIAILSLLGGLLLIGGEQLFTRIRRRVA